MLPKKDRTVCAWSFNLRRDKFLILGGRKEGFFCLDAMLLIGSCFHTERSEQKNMILEILYRERSQTVLKTSLLFACPTFKGAIFECNPYLFLRLNDFRSYSDPSGPEYNTYFFSNWTRFSWYEGEQKNRRTQIKEASPTYVFVLMPFLLCPLHRL